MKKGYKEKKRIKHKPGKQAGGTHKSGKQKSLKYTGIFQAVQAGFGFVKTDSTGEELFIPRDCVHSAMHGDTVEVKVIHPARGGKSAEADITRVVERGTDSVVGTFEAGNISRRTGEMSYGFVVPDNKHYNDDIFVSRERSKGAKEGDKVVVRITDYGNKSRGHKPEGIITEILGDIYTPGVDITSIVRGYGLPERFTKEVLLEAEKVAHPADETDISERTDFRDRMTVTIDGDDSKDFDDAVSLYRKGEAWVLGVHIADVSEYVKEHSELDKEAFKRGTSVYLPDRVIPMLPEVLSNGICSLNPDEERLTLSCVMKLDDKGRVKSSKIVEGVIRSRHRMTYANVQRILDGDEAVRKEYEDVVPMLEDMNRVARLIRSRRVKHGAIDFDLPEADIILDESGKAVDVRLHDRNDATRLIEDFMLMANAVVAETFAVMHMPFIYRIHDEPDADSIRELAYFVSGFGYHLKLKKDDNAGSKELQKLIKDTEGTEAERLIRSLALRAMKQAGYSTECKGHYGLAMEYYTHFTSPIRRYPDLQIHRIIKEYLRNELTGKRISHYHEILGKVAEQSGFLERRADDVERDADKLKMVEYMTGHIGEEYDGIISGVTDWGIYVELPNCIEGMIPLRDMSDDYYELDDMRHQVKGRATGMTYRLGAGIRVKIIRADKLSCEIDMAVAEQDR